MKFTTRTANELLRGVAAFGGEIKTSLNASTPQAIEQLERCFDLIVGDGAAKLVAPNFFGVIRIAALADALEQAIMAASGKAPEVAEVLSGFEKLTAPGTAAPVIKVLPQPAGAPPLHGRARMVAAFDAAAKKSAVPAQQSQTHLKGLARMAAVTKISYK